MSLSARQLRALDQIEKTLTGDYPGLGPLFAIFTRLTSHEAMPVTERVTARQWRWHWRWQRIRAGVATVVGLAVLAGALLTLSLTLPGQSMCPGIATAGTGHIKSIPAGRQPDCAAQQSKPGKIGVTRPATISVDP